MASLTVVETSIEGFQALDVTNGQLGLTIIPELGGKISSLRDMRSGREWLWRNPRMPYQRVQHGVSYTSLGDTGGWDECFPSVAACAYPAEPWQGVAIQDHGELWSQPTAFAVEEHANLVNLRTSWHGIALPYTFQRVLTLDSDSTKLRVEYLAANESDSPIAWIWSLHPLLAIEPGMRLLLPPDARFNSWAMAPHNLLGQNRDLRFPIIVRAGEREIDLTTLPDASAAVALKLWSEPLAEGWAALHANDGELRMRWDVATLPQVGFWLNLGAWAGDGGAPYFNLGLEPCIGAQDSLEQAVERGMFATLPPRGSYTWSLEIELVLSSETSSTP